MTEFTPELSRVIIVARLSPNGVDEFVEANATERSSLAKRFDILELKSLKAWLKVTPALPQIVLVKGKIQATVLQNCIVTLEPLTNYIDLDVDLIFKPGEKSLDDDGEPILDEGEDDTEVFAGGRIDLGEIVAQHLGINIDPYPRKPNAALEVTEFGSKPAKVNPFAQLSALAIKTRPPSDD